MSCWRFVGGNPSRVRVVTVEPWLPTPDPLFMPYTLKRLLVGKAKKTAMALHERLSKKTGLAVFASDALSSTAYATEEILLVLAVAFGFGQGNAFTYVVPITMAIVLVLVIVAISYRQTIFAYPSGGGAYIVAKDNLGT